MHLHLDQIRHSRSCILRTDKKTHEYIFSLLRRLLLKKLSDQYNDRQDVAKLAVDLGAEDENAAKKLHFRQKKKITFGM